MYKRLLGINSRNIRALSQIGELYYRQGHFDKAITYYEEIIKAAPASEHARLALLNMGGILLEAERYTEAIDAYNKALVISPKDDAALYNLGIAYRHLGKTEKAIDCWKQASQLNPDNARPALALADLLYENGYLDEAVKEYELVSEKWPAVSEAHFALATIFFKKDQFDFALRRYDKVITMNNNPELVRKSYINQAIILSRDGANEETIAKATQSARKALMLKPGDPAALLTLGNIFFRQELYDRAIETWYQALKSSPDRETTAMAWNNIGKACYKKGDYKESLRAFTRALEDDPTNEEIRINRKAAMQAYEQNL